MYLSSLKKNSINNKSLSAQSLKNQPLETQIYFYNHVKVKQKLRLPRNYGTEFWQKVAEYLLLDHLDVHQK